MACAIKAHEIKGTYVELTNGKLVCILHYLGLSTENGENGVTLISNTALEADSAICHYL